MPKDFHYFNFQILKPLVFC